jgi:hypothetical protein
MRRCLHGMRRFFHRLPRGGLAPLLPPRLLATGVEVSTFRGEPAPRHSLLPPPLTTSTPRPPKERAPVVRVASTHRPSVPGAPTAGSSAPSCTSPTLAPTAVPRAGLGRGRVGLHGVHGHPLLETTQCQIHFGTS